MKATESGMEYQIVEGSIDILSRYRDGENLTRDDIIKMCGHLFIESDDLEQSKPKSPWIRLSIGNTLPANGEAVLMFLPKAREQIAVCHFYPTDQFGATHWMPLPESPE